MRAARIAACTAVLVVAFPSVALAAEEGDGVQTIVRTGAGVAALLLAAVLLVEMLRLRKLAEGAAIAEHITYAVLGVAALASSVLVSWIARFVPEGFSEAQARLGSDVLTVGSLVLFGVYFLRVRRATSRFLRSLAGEAQLVVAALDESAEVGETESGGDAVDGVETGRESSAEGA